MGHFIGGRPTPEPAEEALWKQFLFFECVHKHSVLTLPDLSTSVSKFVKIIKHMFVCSPAQTEKLADTMTKESSEPENKVENDQTVSDAKVAQTAVEEAWQS